MKTQLWFRRTISLVITAIVPMAMYAGSWIRINQIGYLPEATKVAVYMDNDAVPVTSFEVVDAFTGNVELKSSAVRLTGKMGAMKTTYRLDFSSLKRPGAYFLRVITDGRETRSEVFPINTRVYDGTADFALNYMRQQRCGWNPFLRDSCHTKDAIIVGHPDSSKDSTYLDVRGGWHDASDCLQYTTTSANAIYQMMFAYQQNPLAFSDTHLADGTPGYNGIPDIVDEIYWGLQWLDKMNPAPGEMYNQIADDRDHVGMKKPSEEQANYGWGPGQERPVWYCSGEPQRRGKTGLKNKTTGISSTAGKFASDFALGAKILGPFYPEFAEKIGAKAAAAYEAGLAKPGVCQTASVLSPYIYEEDNWTDDMELAAMELYHSTGDRTYLESAVEFGRREPVTPWMGADSARHYQWYPFMNMGHYHLAKEGTSRQRDEFIQNLRAGIERVREKAEGTPFMNGIPAIWCSNNLTTAMLTQCILYRQLTGDHEYEEMEGSLRDWLLGCNPWGVSMIVELPRGGVYPLQPHSYIPRMGMGNTTGGLVDGPVYATIFGSLLGISTEGGTNYEEFQPGDRVYHDSTHDYSTNEPTMDGTACLTFPFSAYQEEGRRYEARTEGNAQGLEGLIQHAVPDNAIRREGGVVRTDPSVRHIDFVFTSADKNDGAEPIRAALKKANIRGYFFFTGEFYEKFPETVQALLNDGHYVGSHSYGHLLYLPWERDGSMNVTREEFNEDTFKSYSLLREAGIEDAPLFLPPYEHYNSTVASWARMLGIQLVNYTNGTATNGDYTLPSMKNYYSSKTIFERIRSCEAGDPDGLSGHIMLIHLGTEPARTDKFYNQLPKLIRELRRKGYTFTPLSAASRH